METENPFQKFPKIPRLKKGCVITEKIDGTNAQIYFPDDYNPEVIDSSPMHVGSRNRIITPERDNYGFARWAYENEEQLFSELGYGRHYGEWWGSGIQRRYGMDHKRFSLFNTHRWEGCSFELCHVVPVLYTGDFCTDAVDLVLEALQTHGSKAAPGFMDPEGVVIYLPAARQLFKQTFDDSHKG
jgi:hypothetical protein